VAPTSSILVMLHPASLNLLRTSWLGNPKGLSFPAEMTQLGAHGFEKCRGARTLASVVGNQENAAFQLRTRPSDNRLLPRSLQVTGKKERGLFVRYFRPGSCRWTFSTSFPLGMKDFQAGARDFSPFFEVARVLLLIPFASRSPMSSWNQEILLFPRCTRTPWVQNALRYIKTPHVIRIGMSHNEGVDLHDLGSERKGATTISPISKSLPGNPPPSISIFSEPGNCIKAALPVPRRGRSP